MKPPVAFDQIKILTLNVPQSDSLNLSFVKDLYAVAKKWPEMVLKWPFMGHIFFVFFLQNWKLKERKKIVICVVVVDPIKILVCCAHQNDHYNLSFVKAIIVVGRKLTRNTHKMANS